MAEATPPGDRPIYTPPPRRTGGGRPLTWLFVLVVLGAAAWGGWRALQWAQGAMTSREEMTARVGHEIDALRAQSAQLSARQAELAAALQRNGTELAALGGRIDNGEQAMARLADAVEGGRARVQLAAVEQLLLMANDRLLLARDVASALKALDLADQRLALLNDPRLFKLRETLAQERAALAAVAQPDLAGASLSLSEILKRAPALPLRGHVPEHFETSAAPAAPAAADGALARLWHGVKTALANVFALRRSDAPRPRLLAPEEAALVAQILQLKLEGARLALLVAARAWLDQYYDETDPDVRAAAAELERLRAMNLAPPLPDISRSLAQLRTVAGAASR
jgi:uncharacterized protein HemX